MEYVLNKCDDVWGYYVINAETGNLSVVDSYTIVNNPSKFSHNINFDKVVNFMVEPYPVMANIDAKEIRGSFDKDTCILQAFGTSIFFSVEGNNLIVNGSVIKSRFNNGNRVLDALCLANMEEFGVWQVICLMQINFIGYILYFEPDGTCIGICQTDFDNDVKFTCSKGSGYIASKMLLEGKKFCGIVS